MTLRSGHQTAAGGGANGGSVAVDQTHGGASPGGHEALPAHPQGLPATPSGTDSMMGDAKAMSDESLCECADKHRVFHVGVGDITSKGLWWRG